MAIGNAVAEGAGDAPVAIGNAVAEASEDDAGAMGGVLVASTNRTTHRRRVRPWERQARGSQAR